MHTFYSVDRDGEGGPGFEDRKGAEAFIVEDVANYNDDEVTAEMYTIRETELTWAEWLALGEWDGY